MNNADGDVGRAPLTPLTSYQKRLFVFLSVATFFEGYDFLALAQILPELRREMGITTAEEGALISVINVGTILAYFLVRKADRWGRRRVMTVTIAGYTLCSLLTGFAPNVPVFAGLQLLARIFLIGEWAVAMIYAAEEYPKDRRGMVIGVIQACASLGAITCAGVVPLLLKTQVGWRAVYFVGAIPLVIIAFARRNLRETARFQAREVEEKQQPLGTILRSPYKKRMLQMAGIWALTYICTQNAVLFWKEFATSERGLTSGQVGTCMTIAATSSLPLIFAAGKLLDRIGRRRGAVVIFVLTAVGVFGAYSLRSVTGLTVSLVLAIFGVTAVLPVLNAFTSELFPTSLRSDAFAWSNNLLGRSVGVLSHMGVGVAAAQVGWGPTIAATSVFPLIALGLIWGLLPETVGKELEETSATA
jgi:MFS transporter, putative metabolite:H+ symporter